MSPDLDAYEHEAIKAASEAGGAFLEKLGKFDIALLSPDEWRLFLRAVYLAATDKVRELRSTEECPF